MSYLWTLLQLSRAEPATLHHLPPTSAFSQGVLEPTHKAVTQAQCPSTAKEVTLKGTPDSQCSGEATGTPLHTGTTYSQQEKTSCLSPAYSLICSSLWAFCVHKIVLLTHSPRASLQWGCFFQCLITVAVITECHVAAQHCTAVSPKPSQAQGAVGRVNSLVQKLGISEYCLQIIKS